METVPLETDFEFSSWEEVCEKRNTGCQNYTIGCEWNSGRTP